jgi:hypothetical protein
MDARSPRVFNHRWALDYNWAVAEKDDDKRIHLIALAKSAIFERQRELGRSRGQHIDEEHAMQDALYVLNALRKASEFNRRSR